MFIGLSLALTQYTGGGNNAPNGFGFLAIGSPSSYQIVYVGSTVAAPRIAVATGA